jgi:alkanesulfonate monooxygenase SsuD/methylene tetrahydromethanopterin reductase-like flavin-dependent oxidoreductase (luciferase family)
MEICLQTMVGYEATLELARWCEAEGVPALSVADHYLSGRDVESPGYEQFVILGGIARETSTLELSTLVSPITFRHPSVHLKAAVTLDEMSGGRFTLGVGTGWMELEHESYGIEFPAQRERFDRLEETLGYLKAATDGSGSGFDGTYYKLAAFNPNPQPTNLRIVVGGGGPRRTPDLAARFADEFNAFPDETPIARRIERCLATAEAEGRTDDILISTAFPSAVAPDAEQAEELLTRRAERRKVDLAELKAFLQESGIPHGSINDAAAAYAELAEAGITRVYLQMSANSVEEIAQAVDCARRAAELAG